MLCFCFYLCQDIFLITLVIFFFFDPVVILGPFTFHIFVNLPSFLQLLIYNLIPLWFRTTACVIPVSPWTFVKACTVPARDAGRVCLPAEWTGRAGEGSAHLSGGSVLEGEVWVPSYCRVVCSLPSCLLPVFGAVRRLCLCDNVIK